MNRSKGKFQGKSKVRSIYSPGYHGTRVPDGKPGAHRPLLSPEEIALADLRPQDAYALREAKRKFDFRPGPIRNAGKR